LGLEKYKGEEDMEITIKIQAPELAEALNNIAHVIAITVSGMDKGLEPEQPQQALSNNAPINNIPVTNIPITNVPIQQPQQFVPTQAPVQQLPVQQQQPVQQAPTQQYTAPPAQQAPTQQYTAPPAQQSVPTQAQSYTMDQLAIAATQLMDAGKRNELVNLLAQFGVQALTALPKEQYGAFATALRGMGARI